MEGKTTEAETGKGQLALIETKLRATLANWRHTLETIGTGLQERLPKTGTPDPSFKSWHNSIYRVIAEMDSAREDLRVVGEDLAAAKVDAEYGSVLVTTWPANHYLDRMAYVGTAIIGAGGAAFLVGAGIRDFAEWWVPPVFLWGIGLTLLIYALRGLADWERQKFDFYAQKLGVPDQYRPRIFRKKDP